MDKVGIVNSGILTGMKPKYIIVGDSITPEQHAEACKQAGCELEEMIFMTPEEYKVHCQLTQPTYEIHNHREAIEQLNAQLPRDYSYVDDKKTTQPWYAQFDKKGGRRGKR